MCNFQVSLYDDCSTDNSVEVAVKWLPKLKEKGIKLVVGLSSCGASRGPGFARNRAIQQSTGRYLCFLDADDIMWPERIRLQYEVNLQYYETMFHVTFVSS